MLKVSCNQEQRAKLDKLRSFLLSFRVEHERCEVENMSMIRKLRNSTADYENKEKMSEIQSSLSVVHSLKILDRRMEVLRLLERRLEDKKLKKH